MRPALLAIMLIGLSDVAAGRETLAQMLKLPDTQAEAAQRRERLEALLRAVPRKANSYEDAVAEFSRVVRIYDRNGDGVTDAELDVADQLEAAAIRGQMAMSFLPADLDNDLKVTLEEFETVGRIGTYAGTGLRSFAEADLNGDRVLDWNEMTTPPDRGERTSQKARLRSNTLDLDPTPETPYTLADATALADELFSIFDRNNDRLISTEEGRSTLKMLAQKLQSSNPFVSPKSKPSDQCDAPRPVAGDEVVMIGAYEGVAYSTLRVGAPDEPTFVVEVKVEAGEKPLFVMAGSYESIIWKFTGETSRVRQVVLAGHEQQAASGLPRSAVAFTGYRECFRVAHEFDNADFEKMTAAASIKAFAGRDDLLATGSYSLFGVTVPAMMLSLAPKLGRFDNPVVAVDAATVVSPFPVEPYAVMPGRAGLAQLLADGSILQIDDRSFRIVKPIPHFPADLAGAHAVRFLVAKGVPMPAGSPGHSCVILEETGQSVGVPALCRF